MEVNCLQAGPDPTGELTSGALALRGRAYDYHFEGHWPVSSDPRASLLNLFTLDILEHKAGTVGVAGNVDGDYDIPLPGPGFIDSGETVYGAYA